MSRKVSPGSSLPAPALPRPGGRRTPTAPSRISPAGSRGASPHVGNGSPHSPRVGNVRVRGKDKVADMRRIVIHTLALGESSMSGLKAKLHADDGSDAQGQLVKIVQEVAEKRGMVLKLREALWSEVSDGYEGYTDAERARVREARDGRVNGGGGGGENGSARGLVEPSTGAMTNSIGTHGMSHAQLEERLDAYERDERTTDVKKIRSDEDESDLRRRFAKWFPVYQAMIGRMDDMKKAFAKMEKGLSDARNSRDRDLVVKEIRHTHDKYHDMHARCVKMLPTLHRRLKDMRSALDASSTDDRL